MEGDGGHARNAGTPGTADLRPPRAERHFRGATNHDAPPCGTPGRRFPSEAPVERKATRLPVRAGLRTRGRGRPGLPPTVRRFPGREA